MRLSNATDISGGVDGNWTVAQFDNEGNLRVTTAIASLVTIAGEEPQQAAGAGSGTALVADMSVRQLLAAILFELVHLRKQEADSATSVRIDYVRPIFQADAIELMSGAVPG